MTDEHRAYSRGYYAASKHAWPSNRPPVPPDAVIGNLVAALQSLRDAADDICAVLTENDEWAQTLDPLVKKADTALSSLTEWLQSGAAAIGAVTTGRMDTKTPSIDDADEQRGDCVGTGTQL